MNGCVDVVRTVVTDTDPANRVVGIRPGSDGKPLAAYRGGGWFYGLYWAGATSAGQGSQEELYLNLGLGLDITRVYARKPTRDLGDHLLLSGELMERAGRVVEVLMQAGSAVANACNAQLTALRAALVPPLLADGLFRENFDTPNIGQVRFESPDWIAAKPPQDVKNPPPTVFVVRLSLTGLKFHKLLSECIP